MAWRLAKSLEVLRSQINAMYPNRSKESDGSIGDEAHSSRTSDHNPNPDGVVCAIDVTHDPVNGPDSEQLANLLLASRDSRIKYIISNKKIAAGTDGPAPWKWRRYTGSNPHNHHVHISVKASKLFYDLSTPWSIIQQPVGIASIPPDVDPGDPEPPKPGIGAWLKSKWMHITGGTGGVGLLGYLTDPKVIGLILLGIGAFGLICFGLALMLWGREKVANKIAGWLP